MADKKISQLTAASTPLAGTEVLPIVQSGSTVKVSSDDLTVKNVRSNASTGILQITGPAAGSTRVMTTPNANFTAARTDAAQTFTGVQTFSNAIQGNSNVIGSSGATYAAFETNNLGTHSVGVSNGANAAFIGKTTGAGSSTVAFTFGYPSATYMPAEFAYLQTNNGGETTGDFVWYLRSGTTDSQPSEVYRLTSGGNAKINNGNLVVGTAAKGIDFSANSHAAGMTSELLNWYEEGTFTPTVVGSTTAGTATYGGANGRYTRIGRTVQFEIYLDWTSGTGTGNLRFGALPFTANASLPYASAVIGYIHNFNWTAGTYPMALVIGTEVNFFLQALGGGNIANMAYSANGTAYVSGSYSV